MKISVIIPTFNESVVIGDRIKFIKTHGGEFVEEVIVCDGNSDDETGFVATREGAHVVNCNIRSRAAQMNAGAAIAKGEVLYFVHADTQLPIAFVSDILHAIQQNYDSGCYRYVFDSPKRMLKINAWFTRLDSLMCRGGDQTLFVRKEVFKKLNGFNEYFTIMEDYDFIIRLRKQFTFCIIPKNVIVSARKYDTNSWLRVQISNLIAFIMFRLKISPEKIKKTYKKMLNYRHDGIRN